MKKMISWNVNGLRAAMKKGFAEFFEHSDADIFCLQETKLQEGQIDFSPPGYNCYWNSAVKKGYSSTAVFTKEKPLSVSFGMNIEEHDQEGRVISLEFADFYLVNVYTPNSKAELLRLPYRMEWEDAFRTHLLALDSKKPVIICGDLNVAHKEIDLKNPKTNRRNAGFTDEERDKLSLLLDAGFTDSFRHLYPDITGAYTWWSYRANARANNAGWRIDYFLVSEGLSKNISQASIYADIHGSDHCPVGLIMDI